MSKGFVILAENTAKVDYVKCAEVLARSIYKSMPHAKVSIVTNSPTHRNIFDKVISLPMGDLAASSDWKLINDFQVYEASPYDYTIKLEADMFLPRSIDHWWDVLKARDLVVCTTIRDYRQDISKERFYRKFIDENNLPDCYNAITYFKKSKTAEEFFTIVKDIFFNWDSFKDTLKCNKNEPATTDWIYALASQVMSPEVTTMPAFKEMSMVHMKQFINRTPSEDWTDKFIYELKPDVFRINTIPQQYPVHYHVKKFANELENAYG